ncbi:hypothetical protein [Rhodopirellula bahusiensis]|uniref:hypothetical protein n=1 Tax=Rhodopirellula bahusiensis TaxID=2014065 RepID=UPI003262E064
MNVNADQDHDHEDADREAAKACSEDQADDKAVAQMVLVQFVPGGLFHDWSGDEYPNDIRPMRVVP